MRVDKPGGSWLPKPWVHLSLAECCDRFALAVVALLLLRCCCSPACVGRSLALSFLGWWEWVQHLLMSMGSQERGKTRL